MRNRVKLKVEALLKHDANNRDSDKKLLLSYWQHEVGLMLTPDQRQKFMEATPAESITRARRELKGKYPPSEAVEQARYNKFNRFRNQYSKPVVIFPNNNNGQGELSLGR